MDDCDDGAAWAAQEQNEAERFESAPQWQELLKQDETAYLAWLLEREDAVSELQSALSVLARVTSSPPANELASFREGGKISYAAACGAISIHIQRALVLMSPRAVNLPQAA